MMKRMELLLFSRYPFFFFIEIYLLSNFKNELDINFMLAELCREIILNILIVN